MQGKTREPLFALESALAALVSAIDAYAHEETSLAEEKKEAWMRAAGPSISAREKEVEFATLDFASEVRRTRANYEACKATFEAELAKVRYLS